MIDNSPLVAAQVQRRRGRRVSKEGAKASRGSSVLTLPFGSLEVWKCDLRLGQCCGRETFSHTSCLGCLRVGDPMGHGRAVMPDRSRGPAPHACSRTESSWVLLRACDEKNHPMSTSDRGMRTSFEESVTRQAKRAVACWWMTARPALLSLHAKIWMHVIGRLQGGRASCGVHPPSKTEAVDNRDQLRRALQGVTPPNDEAWCARRAK